MTEVIFKKEVLFIITTISKLDLHYEGVATEVISQIETLKFIKSRLRLPKYRNRNDVY